MWWGRFVAIEARGGWTNEPSGRRRPRRLPLRRRARGVLASGPADLTLGTVRWPGPTPQSRFENSKASRPVPAELRLQHVSIAAGDGPIFRFEGTALGFASTTRLIAPVRDAEATLVSTDTPASLDWRGRSNLYSKIGTFLQPTGTRPPREPIRDWSSWENSLAEVREADLVAGPRSSLGGSGSGTGLVTGRPDSDAGLPPGHDACRGRPASGCGWNRQERSARG